MPKPRLFVGVLLVAVFAITISAVLHSGSFLVVANVHRADAILVLAGDVNDRRYQKGVELLRREYGMKSGPLVYGEEIRTSLWSKYRRVSAAFGRGRRLTPIQS